MGAGEVEAETPADKGRMENRIERTGEGVLGGGMKRILFGCLIAVVAPCHAAEKPVVEMAAAAQDFLASLNKEQRAKAVFPIGEDERFNWHFVPRDRREGIPFGELTEAQMAKAKRVIETAMSAEGLLKVETIIRLEELLGEIEANPAYRDATKYYTTVFGEPSDEGVWAWRFEGHHLSLNLSFAAGKVAGVTPLFMGANRAHTTEGRMQGTRPFAAEEDLARELAVSLSEDGKPVVYTDRAPSDILTGADRELKQLDPVGMKAGEMSAGRREGLMALIREYANRYRSEIAAEQIARIEADLENVRFGWAGGLKPGEAFYYRIQGSFFLIEVSNIQNDANHIHTVWRDAENDYGGDALGDHAHGH